MPFVSTFSNIFKPISGGIDSAVIPTPTPTQTPTPTTSQTPAPTMTPTLSATPTLTPTTFISTQLLTNPDFTLGSAGWSATGGFGTYSYTSSNQVAISGDTLYFTYVSRTVSQTRNVSSYVSGSNNFVGVANLRHRQKGDDGTYTQIDTYNFSLIFKDVSGNTLITKTTGTSNAPQYFTDITLTLNRSEIPATYDNIATVTVQLTGIDSGYWNGNHGPMVNYITLTTT